MNYPTLNDPFFSGDEKQQLIELRHLNGAVGGGATARFSRSTPAYGSSPFPNLEKFLVYTLGKRKGLVGSLGTWCLCTQRPLPQTICFNMKGNRYCERIERAHKSNGIIWNVHLIDRLCWQSCHDPECKGFRGKPVHLPEKVNDEIDEYFLDSELSSLKESEFLCDSKNEFDDPDLDTAMCQLDISSIAREKEAEEALNTELENLKIASIVLNSGGKSSDNPESGTAMCQLDIFSLAREKEVEEALNIELANLNLSDIVSSIDMKSRSDKNNPCVDVLNQTKLANSQSVCDISTSPSPVEGN